MCARRRPAAALLAGRAGQDNAYLDDYAGLANALLTLYESGGPAARLDQAIELADEILATFRRSEHSGFFYTAGDHEPLIVRKKDAIDSPVPSGNGLAATLLVRLAGFAIATTTAPWRRRRFERVLAWMQRAPTATFQLLLAMGLLEESPSAIE